MILDFVLVSILLVCLTLLTTQKKEVLLGLERNSLVAGILLSAIQMMMLAGLLEKIWIFLFFPAAKLKLPALQQKATQTLRLPKPYSSV